MQTKLNLKMETLMSVDKNESLWKKIVHVGSSMESKQNQRVLFIGRWQPLHIGHITLFQQSLSEGKKILIAIRDTDVSEKNPYKADQVKTNIEIQFIDEVLSGDVEVIIIPDICEVAFGRGVGYDIVEYLPPKQIANISATKIRKQLKHEGKL